MCTRFLDVQGLSRLLLQSCNFSLCTAFFRDFSPLLLYSTTISALKLCCSPVACPWPTRGSYTDGQANDSRICGRSIRLEVTGSRQQPQRPSVGLVCSYSKLHGSSGAGQESRLVMHICVCHELGEGS